MRNAVSESGGIKKISLLLCVVLVLVSMMATAVPVSAASNIYRANVSYSYVTGNASVTPLPANVKDPKVGDKVYFNFQVSSDIKVKSAECKVTTPDKKTVKVASEKPKNYIRYAYNGKAYKLEKEGTYSWVWTLKLTNGKNKTLSGTFKAKKDTSRGSDNKYWAMPMVDAYATWGTNWSWLSNCNDYGRVNNNGRNYHIGVDLMSKTDSSVYSIGGGTVAEAGKNKTNGNYVTVKQSLEGKTIYVFYAHLDSIAVKAGQKVDKGTKLGVAGHTGSAAQNSITHLHLSVVDSLSKGGGYYGYATKDGLGSNVAKYGGRTFYNPIYIIENNKLPKS